MIELPPPYPLTWPNNKPRTPPGRRVKGSYIDRGYAEAMATLEGEIARWQRRERTTRITDWQITATHVGRNQPASDPGASLWFILGGQDITQGASLRVLACDKFTKLPQNMRALSLTMERLRLVDEIGAYSLIAAVEGARALPPPSGSTSPALAGVAAAEPSWREVLGVAAGAPLAVAQAAYRALAKDAGEGSAKLKELNVAIAAARQELA
jgi:hypothetical protein